MPISSDLRVWSLWTYRFLAETHDFWRGKNSSSGGSGSSVSQKPTRNSNRCSRVHAPATRVRPKPSFDRAVSGEDDRVPGGSWTALSGGVRDLREVPLVLMGFGLGCWALYNFVVRV